MNLASAACAEEVSLDSSFGKDDLLKTDILYANEQDGIFAFELNGDANDYAGDECASVLPVSGGGVRRLIKGLNAPMNYDTSLPLMILNNDTFIFHTVESLSFAADGRYSQKVGQSWATRFTTSRWDEVDFYLYRQVLLIDRISGKNSIYAIEQRFDPNGHLRTSKEITPVCSNLAAGVPFDGQPASKVRIENGDMVLAGRVVLKHLPTYPDLTCYRTPASYYWPHADPQGRFVVYVEFTGKGGLVRSQLRYLKLLDSASGKVATLRETRNVIRCPQLSPDASRILFIENDWLYLLELGTQHVRRIDKAKVANWAIRTNTDPNV